VALVPAERVVIEVDADGFRYRQGEVLAMDLDPADLERVRDLGYQVVAMTPLDGVNSVLYVLRGARRSTEAVEELATAAPKSVFGLNHLFGVAGTSTSAERRTIPAAPPAMSACHCRIGMIDTGVDSAHPELRGMNLHQHGFGGSSVKSRAHGSGVASVIARLSGSSSGATDLYVADIFADSSQAGSAASVTEGLSWLAGTGVGVINISLTGPANPVVSRMVQRLQAKGMVLVAAAGNDGPAAPPVFPAAYAGVVAVTAVDDHSLPYRYANRGDYVMFAARGVAVRVAGASGSYQTVSGTSFASPAVAALLARTLTSPDPLKASKAVAGLGSRAVDLGAPGRDPVFGLGLISTTP